MLIPIIKRKEMLLIVFKFLCIFMYLINFSVQLMLIMCNFWLAWMIIVVQGIYISFMTWAIKMNISCSFEHVQSSGYFLLIIGCKSTFIFLISFVFLFLFFYHYPVIKSDIVTTYIMFFSLSNLNYLMVLCNFSICHSQKASK